MNEDPLPTKVTIDQGNLIRGVIKSWNENLLKRRLSDARQLGLRISGHDAAEVHSPEEH